MELKNLIVLFLPSILLSSTEKAFCTSFMLSIGDTLTG